MAYTFTVSLSLVEQDGLGGQTSLSHSIATVVPTKPAFRGAGTATTTPTAISYGPVTTPKCLVIINDGAVEITVDIGTDTFLLGVTSSTAKSNFCVITTFAATPILSTGSSTAAYRTLIVE